jgi:hypothetical protein
MEWFCLNDENVKKACWNDIRANGFGTSEEDQRKRRKDGGGSSAYVLLYIREKYLTVCFYF